MHAFLVVGKTHDDRVKKTIELLDKYKAKEVVTLMPANRTHTINSIRELTHTLSLRSPDIRGVVIEEADKLSIESANAFLKTLEEPPKDTILILTAPEKDSVIDTVVSRCIIENLGTRIVELTDKEKGQAQELFDKLLKAGIGERFKFVDTVKDREQALQFVIGQIYAAREAMLMSANQQSAKIHTFANLLNLLSQTQKDLEANVNTKLALTELLLHYPKV